MCMLRYSRGPDEDMSTGSRDYEADVEMPGLSATPLRPEQWWSRPAEDWVARRVCKYLALADGRPDGRPWVLTGEIVGYGPDHEPLLGDVRPLAWIGSRAVAQARQRYRERFNVGRTSTDED